MKRDLRIGKIDFEQSFNRNLFFLHFTDGEVIKTEFTFFPFPRVEKGGWQYGVHLDSVLDIAVNKLFTIYQRVKARDYIDLYCLCRKQGFLIDDLIKQAKIKFDWHIDSLQLGTQFLMAQKAMDYPRMIQKIKPEEWRLFFAHEAQKLKENILKK